MARRREISTEISVDGALRRAMQKGGLLCGLLFTWAVAHADDWGRITGDGDELKMMVLPGAGVSADDIDQAADCLAEEDLWTRYEARGRQYIAFKKRTWFQYQNYVPKAKRRDDSASKIPRPPGDDWPTPDGSRESDDYGEDAEESRNSPQNAEEGREVPTNAAFARASPQNPASPSPSLSPSPTLSDKRKLILLTVAEPDSREFSKELKERMNAARRRLSEIGVVPRTISDLLSVEPERLRDRVDVIEAQLDYLPYRLHDGMKQDPPRILVASIRGNDGLGYEQPVGYQIAVTEATHRQEQAAAAAQRREARDAEKTAKLTDRQQLERRWASYSGADKEILEAQVSRRMKAKHYVGPIFEKNPNSVAVAGPLWEERAAAMAELDAHDKRQAKTA